MRSMNSMGFTRRTFFAGLGSLALLASTGQISAAAGLAQTYPYLLGDATVNIKVFQNGNGSTFVCPHDNENTASTVALRMVRSHGGTLIELSHKGTRNITFNHEGASYEFDPNRMFSDRGIKASLQAQGGRYSQEAHALVENFASVVKLYIKPGQIIAMHNNTNGSYSALSYKEGGDMQREAQQVHINPDIDPDDFYFVTTQAAFNRLQRLNFNVVLQSRRATDDGSLSVYAARSGKPYVNVEAQSGHSSVQRAMLEALL